MRILITGANGFTGYHLCGLLLHNGHTVIATGLGDCRLPYATHPQFVYQPMDFTHPGEVQAVVQAQQPDAVIHAGALSKPDECELHPERAETVNITGTKIMLDAAATCGARFLFLSTDFIFNGATGMYRETDEPGPVNAYGQSKLQAELLVQQYQHDWSIVRTVLVYGPNFSGRKNILNHIREKLEKGERYQLVNDQYRTPTYVGDLAAGIAAILEKKATGIFHIAGDDFMTPYQLGVMTASYLGLDPSLLQPVTAATFREPARRPLRTGFSIDKAKRELGYLPVTLEEGLRKTFFS